MFDDTPTARLVRVLHIGPDRVATSVIEPRVEPIEELLGAPAHALAVDIGDRLVLYVADNALGAPVNPRASAVFGGRLTGSVVLAALRASGDLDDLSDAELAHWRARLGGQPNLRTMSGGAGSVTGGYGLRDLGGASPPGV